MLQTKKFALILTLGGVFTAAPALALVTNLSDAPIDFLFSNPGARANAMGGAFIGLADDATAAYTNPAGLTILTKPETSIEYKTTRQTMRLYRMDGSPAEVESSTKGVSFLSFVHPGEKVSLALYRHQFINMKLDDSVLNLDPSMGTKLVTNLDLKGVTYGLGMGVKVAKNLSLGGSVGFSQLDYKHTVDGNATINSAMQEISTVNDTASAEQYTLSVLYTPIEELGVGLVYRYGPEFNTIYRDAIGTRLQNTLDLPDMYGIGTSYRFANGLTLAADVNRIRYSDLLKNYMYYDPNSMTTEHYFHNNGEFVVDDTTEIHAGFEYVFSLKQTPLALRGGYYRRPDHSIRYAGNAISQYKNTRKAGVDDNIYSLGVGAVFSDNLQLDLSAISGDSIKEYMFSLVYRM